MPTTPQVVRARHDRSCTRCRKRIIRRDWYVSYVLFPADTEHAYDKPFRVSVCQSCDLQDKHPLIPAAAPPTMPPLFEE